MLNMPLVELMPFIVLIPLIGSAIVALLPGRRLPWIVSWLAALASAGIAALILPAAIGGPPLSYAFGNWPAPFGIEYRVDAANAFVALLVAGMAAITLLWAPKSVAAEIDGRLGTFYALFLLALAGLLGITLTGDAFNVFVFLADEARKLISSSKVTLKFTITISQSGHSSCIFLNVL